MLRKLILKVVAISNTVLFVFSTLLMLLASVLIVLVEPETFPTIFDGFWWVMTTVTTVGYGDYSPATFGGRMIALVLYILGIGLIGVVIGKVLDGIGSFRKNREEGNIVYREKGHYIIIGWSHKAEAAIKEMLETKKDTEIVIVDDLEKAPMLSENVHYIRGNVSEGSVLLKANIKEAAAVLIFADERIQDKQLGDGRTLLIASAVESLTHDVHTIAEVMEEAHIKNFEYANVDEFIVSHETISSLFVRSAFRKGISNVYNQLLRRSYGEDLFHVPTLGHWQTYRDAFNELLEDGATLIADHNNLSVNRMLDSKLPANAELYAICNQDTYERIQQKYNGNRG
ncbi:potassium channel family protein [Sediminibacillus albus]|uniref:Voltage-gated potassium channel n=1 Tax=Sediminibacillus albus TaxID=407036 RepID=A0A1G9BYV2_9BACI|nr:potassium channel family protein [Sediminibacillus albus]SDK44656.1 voltage-gated potassium channel [Sediminibacillus albus]